MSSETLRFSNSGASSSWKIYSMGICASSRPSSPVIEEKQMRHRTRSFMRGGAVALVLALAATISIAGQTQSPASAPKAAPASAAAGKAYKAPRTPDGQPDLQGFWTNSTYTPLERPDGVTKEFYTPEEYAKSVKNAAEREGEQTEPGTIADVHYDFTQFGLDRSQGTWAQDLRTSLVVDPPDG